MKVNVSYRGLLILLIGTFLSISCFSQTKKLKLKTEDKSQVIKSVLKQFFEDYPDEVESNEVILSSLNLDTSFVPKQSSRQMILLNPDEIKAKVVRDGFVDYLIFSNFKVKGSKILVKLDSLRSVEYNSEIIDVFGHGFYWEGTRKINQWTFECVNTSAFSTNLSGSGTGH